MRYRLTPKTIIDRSGQCILHRPAALESDAYSAVVKASDGGPLRHGVGFTIVRKVFIRPSIVVLNLARNPLTVFREISFRVVNSFKRMFVGRPLAHVRDKVGEIIPAFTNVNTSAPIIRELAIGWIQAPLAHCFPNVVNRSFRKTMCLFECHNTMVTDCSYYGNHADTL